jgi:hypothetical protein
MIVEEKDISGTLYRFHPDPDDPKYTAQWIVTDMFEIKGMMILKPSRQFLIEFHKWLDGCTGKLNCSTAVESIERAMKRFNFKELER